MQKKRIITCVLALTLLLTWLIPLQGRAMAAEEKGTAVTENLPGSP